MNEKAKMCVRIIEKRGSTRVQWMVAFLATATVLNYGLETGWMSPMTKVLQSPQSPTGPLTDGEMSWVGSSLSLVAMFGVPLYAYIADVYGRRIGVIAIAVPQVLCWALKLAASNATLLIIARVIGGIPAGGCFNVIPMYAKEISQDDIRGAVVSLAILMQNFGVFAMYAMGSYMDYYTVMWIAITVPLLTCVGMTFAPESPGFLIKKGQIEEATKTVALLRGLEVNDKIVKNEVDVMIHEDECFYSLPHITFTGIFKNRVWRRGFILFILMVTAQAANGMFAIMTYAWSILTTLGVTASPDLLSLVVPALMILGSVTSIVCVERTGRKMLLSSTFILSSISMAAMGATILMPVYGITPPIWLPMVAVAVSAWAYASGVSPMIYVVMSEIFCFQVRAKLIGCIVTFAWFLSSLQVALFTPISDALGMHTMFFAFAVSNLFGAAVTLVLLPETKGKTVEEIEEVLGR